MNKSIMAATLVFASAIAHANPTYCYAENQGRTREVYTEIFDAGPYSKEKLEEIRVIWESYSKTIGQFRIASCWGLLPNTGTEQKFKTDFDALLDRMRARGGLEVIQWKPAAPQNTVSAPTQSRSPVAATDNTAGRTKKPDNHCIKAGNAKDGGITLRNVCQQSVHVVYCYSEAVRGTHEEKYLCKPSRAWFAEEGVTYATQDPGAIEPGKVMNIGAWHSKEKYRVVWMACEVPHIFPVISAIHPNKKSGTGYCVDPQ